MGWKESGLQIIASIIGSGLLLTAVTSLIAEYNKPDISLNVIPHLQAANFTASEDISKQKINYYEIMARNDGRSSATNLKLSMFFFSNLINSSAVVHNENMTIDPVIKYENKDQGIPSLVEAHISRLAQDAMVIIYVWTDADLGRPYYVSASYDQGSEDEPSSHFRSSLTNRGDIDSVAYPQLLAGKREALPLNIQIIIITSILSVIFFAIAIGTKRVKQTLSKEARIKLIDNLQQEVTRLKDAITNDIQNSKIFSCSAWDLIPLEVRGQLFTNLEIKPLENFYNELNIRNLELSHKVHDAKDIMRFNRRSFALSLEVLRLLDSVRLHHQHHMGWIVDHLLPIPAILVGSIFIIYLFEFLPVSFILSLVPKPIDLTATVPLFFQFTTIEGKTFSQHELVLYSVIFCVISFIIRGTVAYYVSRLIIQKFKIYSAAENLSDYRHEKTLNPDWYKEIHLYRFSFLIMGLPLYSIIDLFFYQSIPVPYDSLTLLMIGVDAVRMGILVLIVPRIKFHANTIIRLLCYSSAAVIALSGTLYIILGINMIRSLYDIWRLTIISFSDGVYVNNIVFLILFILFFIVPVGIGVVQLFWVKRLVRKEITSRWRYGSLISVGFLTSIWIITRIVLPLTMDSGLLFSASQLLQLEPRQLDEILTFIGRMSFLLVLIGIIYMILVATISYKEKQIPVNQRWIIIKPKKHIWTGLLSKIPILFTIIGSISYKGKQIPVNQTGIIIKSKKWFRYKAGEQHIWTGPLSKIPILFIIIGSVFIYAFYFGPIYAPFANIESSISNFSPSIDGLALDSAAHTVYTISGNTLSLIDGITNRIVNDVKLDGSNSDTDLMSQNIHMAINPQLGITYVTSPHQNLIYAIDSIGEIVWKNSVEIQIADMKMNPRTTILYILGYKETDYYPRLFLMNGTTNEFIDDIPMAEGVGYIEVDSNNNKIYAASPNSDSINVVNGYTNQIVSNFTNIQMGFIPSIAVNSRTSTLYISGDSGGLYVINSSTTEPKELNILDPKYDRILDIDVDEIRNVVYAGSYSFLSAINGTTIELIDDIPMEGGAGYIEVDSDNNKIYVAGNNRPVISVLSSVDIEEIQSDDIMRINLYGPFESLLLSNSFLFIPDRPLL